VTDGGTATCSLSGKRAVQQADEADEALGGTRLATDDRPDGGAASCPRGQNGRGHRFAAYPRCWVDAGLLERGDGRAVMTVHLLHGAVGAGKTTFAKQLAREKSAVRLTPDEWMSALYGQDPPGELFQDRLRRVLELMWALVAQLTRLEVDVVLDFGFWSRESRDDARQRVRELGAQVVLYEISCPTPERHRRVLTRTAAMPAGALYISEPTIRLLDARVEPPGPDEARIVVEMVQGAVDCETQA
jgi:predicted kinase